MLVRAAIAMLALGLLLPLAGAASVSGPAVYYLQDDASGPAAPGSLESSPPNAAQPSLRFVPAVISQVSPTRFQTASNLSHPLWLVGPVYVALWMGPSPEVHGNLSAVLKLVNASGAHELRNASFALDANASKLPQPMSLLPAPPAVPPSDPAGYAQYVAYHELAQVLPAITPPPKLLYLGFLNMKINATDQVVLDFSIIQGSSPAPVPLGAGAILEYAAKLAPSFVYIPWFEPAMLASPTTYPPYTPPASSGPSASVSHSPAPSSAQESPMDAGKKSPGPELALVLVGIVALSLYVRRRRA